MIWKTSCCGLKKINKKALKMWLLDFVDSYVVHLFSLEKEEKIKAETSGNSTSE